MAAGGLAVDATVMGMAVTFHDQRGTTRRLRLSRRDGGA